MSSTTLKKVFITRQLLPDGQRVLDQASEQKLLHIVQWPHSQPPSRQELIAQLQNCYGILSMVTDRLDGEVFTACPKLKVIANHAVGLDNIDVQEAKARGITIANTPDVLTDSTAELTAGLILSVARRIPELHQEVVQGRWQTWAPSLYLGQELKSKTLGLFGLGRIALRLAHIMHFGFGMKVQGTSRSPNKSLPGFIEWVDFEKLKSTSDWLVALADLNPSNVKIFNHEAFAAMKNGAYFINAARGGLHCEEALYQHLSSKHLAGAGLDVTNPEPMAQTSPLLKLSNVVITPHVGSATYQARNAMSKMAAEKLLSHCLLTQ